MTELDEIIQNPISRRAFLARMSAAGLGAAAAALIAGCGGGGGNANPGNINPGTTTSGATFADQTNFPGIPGQSRDVVVLNYALTLETLEADLYRQALNIASGRPVGAPLPANTSGLSLAVPAGGLSADNAAIGFLYLQQYAAVEAAHRDFLRAAIASNGGTPVPANQNGYRANFGGDLRSILTLINTVEETGVTAYLGAAGFLTNPSFVQVASTIYSTEARHSAAMEYVLGNDIGPSGVAGGAQPVAGARNEFEYAQTPRQVLAGVRPFFA